jgi:hypothetical protein
MAQEFDTRTKTHPVDATGLVGSTSPAGPEKRKPAEASPAKALPLSSAEVSPELREMFADERQARLFRLMARHVWEPWLRDSAEASEPTQQERRPESHIADAEFKALLREYVKQREQWDRLSLWQKTRQLVSQWITSFRPSGIDSN